MDHGGFGPVDRHHGREAQQWPGPPPVMEIGHLATRGLSGCVGLAVGWETGQIALALVFSGCTDGTGKPPGPNTWDDPNGYQARLDYALDETQKGIPNANKQFRFGVLLFSESEPTRTLELLEGWLAGRGIGCNKYPNLSGCDVSAEPEEGEDMDVSKPRLLTNYLIAPVKGGPTWGPGGQLVACERLSRRAHAADPSTRTS